MSVFKAVSEVVVALGQKYDGPTYEREGQGGKKFTYIPWTESIHVLDRIFGVFGWTSSQPQVTVSDGLVHVSLSVTARVLNDETGELIEKTVPGVGSAAARDDNSAKSAMSDALSKAVKYFGDAFGFYLSEGKGRGTGAPAATPAQAQAQATSGARQENQGDGYVGYASPKQLYKLHEGGWSDEQIARLDKGTLRSVMDGLFGKAAVIAPPTQAKDDLPF